MKSRPARSNPSKRKAASRRSQTSPPLTFVSVFRRVVYWGLLFVASFYAFAALSMLYLRFFEPLTTGLQTQRRIEAWAAGDDYDKTYRPLRIEDISVHLRHAVVAAEDGRFYQHHGVDWDAINKARTDNRNRKRKRGGSTITQQLAKNLFLTSHSTVWRKAIELPLSYLIDALLPKDRILEIYLNVIEWGPGIYGAEAAARHHYGVSASRLTRSQSARLAAIIPAPRRRRPQSMNQLGASVLARMRQQGW